MYVFALTFLPGLLAAQTTAATQPDVLILADGEKLIGQFEQGTSSTVTFKSNVLGEVSIPWAKVQELQSPRNFAVIPKSVKLRRGGPRSAVPVGPVTIEDQKIATKPSNAAAPQTPIPVSDVAAVVSQAEFEKALGRESFRKGWTGGATGGISLTEATQKEQSFTGAVNLTRTAPGFSWLDTRSRTTVDFNSAYSKLTQPATPSLKTSIVHLDAEQDWYLNPRLFAFVSGDLDHSFSQGLRLQQTYGGGLGYVLIKAPSQELDAKVSADYISQRFENGTNNNLIGSQFGETYMRKFARGILFNEQANFTPSWNETSAYSLFGSAALTFPVYHRLGFTVGALDDYINNPPPGFKKNSFQLTVGATYALK